MAIMLPKGKATVGLLSRLDAQKSTEMNWILKAAFAIKGFNGTPESLPVSVSETEKCWQSG